MKIPKTPLEATIYPQYTGEDGFFKILKTKQEIDFAYNLINLSRKNQNQWLERLTSYSYFDACNQFNIKFEDSHFLCFERFVKIGYLEKIEGNEYVHKITQKFIEDTPKITHPHPSYH